MRPAFLLLAGVLLASLGCAQVDEPQDPKKPSLVEEVMKQFRDAGIKLDAKAGTVEIPVVVNSPPDPLEYLLIHQRGKKHEALFVTQVKPSLLNAALIALGLEPGKNADYVEIDPPPTPEEVEAGADWVRVIPPNGTQLYMTVCWKDKAGKEHEAAVDDLVRDLTTGITVVESDWIYLGGRMAPLYRNEPPVFVADFEGNLVSICYLRPDNHLATMRHERARDDQNWWMTDLCPPAGTDCTFRFYKKKPEKVFAERLKRIQKEAKEQLEKRDKDK